MKIRGLKLKMVGVGLCYMAALVVRDVVQLKLCKNSVLGIFIKGFREAFSC